ncbi:hypothetical protein [Tateyamaria omphalii]|uniref:Uncharacterized protein n=1 Tax=Tateyamaria omphalii TaxID=299262 RepID=A0A1P8MT86_9RHOB|nr:hypothetical protein [Tateyamaria omphalii]APX11254.1 hypothetical protein BWR18_05825 [Tateyamaria omphalii]
MSTLEARLLAAHADGDGMAMVALYREAAETAPTEAERAFFLTQAHVFAMEVAHPDARTLRDTLVRMGRETPL